MPCARVCSSGAGGDRARRGRSARRCRSAGRASRRRRRPGGTGPRTRRARLAHALLAAVLGDVLAADQRHARAQAGAAEHLAGPVVQPEQRVGDALVGAGQAVDRLAAHGHAAEHRLGGHEVGLVDRGDVLGVGQRRRRELGEAGEPVAGLRAGPAAVVHQPARHREVDERDDRVQAPLAAAVDHAPVVVEGGAGELALLGLDPAPLEAEPVGVQAGAGDEVEVLAPAVVGVAGVAAGLGERRVLGVLHLPVVVVDVAALDLVRGGGGAPEEAVGEGAGHREISSSGAGRGRRRSGRRRRRRRCAAGRPGRRRRRRARRRAGRGGRARGRPRSSVRSRGRCARSSDPQGDAQPGRGVAERRRRRRPGPSRSSVKPSPSRS